MKSTQNSQETLCVSLARYELHAVQHVPANRGLYFHNSSDGYVVEADKIWNLTCLLLVVNSWACVDVLQTALMLCVADSSPAMFKSFAACKLDADAASGFGEDSVQLWGAVTVSQPHLATDSTLQAFICLRALYLPCTKTALVAACNINNSEFAPSMSTTLCQHLCQSNAEWRQLRSHHCL